MIPKSFSATSLTVAEGCLSRYKAEVIDRGSSPGGSAAGVGIVLHGTLEEFLRGTMMRKDLVWTWDVFFKIFCEQYDQVFGADRNRPEWADAHDLAKKWFWRPDMQEELASVKILSLESKHSFPIPVLIEGVKSSIPVNYIMDRLEKIGDHEYRVVDYKSQMVPWTGTQIKTKIQARLYALAVQIVYKDAETVWVEFDFLRHDRVAIAFSKADNAETWRMLKRAAQRIIDTSDSDAERSETINDDCAWCVKRSTCKALISNIAVGGIHSLTDEQKADRLAKVSAAAKALKYLEQELESALLMALIKNETTVLELDNAVISFKRSSRRQLDHGKVALVIGPELTAELGTFTLENIDHLMSSTRISEAQKMALEACITKKMGEPKVNVAIKK